MAGVTAFFPFTFSEYEGESPAASSQRHPQHQACSRGLLEV
jgi:hypothetical protein